MGNLSADFAGLVGYHTQKTRSHGTYAASGFEPYAGPIHIGIVGEDILHHRRCLERISETLSLKHGLYAGAAGFVNLSYIAISQSNSGLLFDINSYQTLFWKSVFSKIRECKSGQEFQKEFVTIIDDIKSLASVEFDQDLQGAFEDYCALPGSFPVRGIKDVNRWITNTEISHPDVLWMHNTQHYQHIRSLVLNGAISAVTLDVSSKEACSAFNAFLCENNQRVRILYTSNILNHLDDQVFDTDFIRRPLEKGILARTRADLRNWMEEDGVLIECDNLLKMRPIMVFRNPPHQALAC